MIELLVVLAVIGILMAVLLPAVLGALDKGKTAHCANNLSQIGKVIPQYAADNKGSLPDVNPPGGGTNTWDVALLAYLGQTTNTFWCVADPSPLPDGTRISYGANGYNNNTPFKLSGGRAAKLADFDSNMGDMILVADLFSADVANKPRIGQAPTIRPGRIPNMHTKGTGANYLMASYAVRYYHKGDSAVTKSSGQGNRWVFVAPP